MMKEEDGVIQGTFKGSLFIPKAYIESKETRLLEQFENIGLIGNLPSYRLFLRLTHWVDIDEWTRVYHINNPSEVLARKFPKPIIISHYALSENWKKDLYNKAMSSINSNGWFDVQVR
jgi:hypothetical protein